MGDRLREALATDPVVDEGNRTATFDMDDAWHIVAAARRLLEAEEGTRADWCNTHDSPYIEWEGACAQWLRVPDELFCTWVPKLLVDPQEGDG